MEYLVVLPTLFMPILLAITLHEAAHAYAANALGDPTAKEAGRLSLIPFRHIHPFGTIIIPVFLYLTVGFFVGFAKPVPVNQMRLRNPRWHMVLVALAGPAANVFLAIIGSLALYIISLFGVSTFVWYVEAFANLVLFNCIFAVFNMLPIPPLDGSRVVAGFLPGRLAYGFGALERYGPVFIIGLFVAIPLFMLAAGSDFQIGRFLIFDPAERMYNLIIGLFN